MTQEEYKAKKHECWEEFKRTNLDGEVQWQPVNCYDVFCAAFDRAYALGREKEIISQDEIDKAAEYYVSFKKGGKCLLSYIIERACRRAFKGGANFALGKQEKDADTVTIDKDVYDKLCKCSRYMANWVPYFDVCPICSEYNQRGCVCANCNNDKNWNNG